MAVISGQRVRASQLSFAVVAVAAAALAALLMVRRPPAVPPPVDSAGGGGSSGVSAGGAAPRDAAAEAGGGPPASSDAGGPCPSDMVFIEGLYCPFVAHRCDTYLGHDPEATALAEDPDEKRRCARYRDDVICEGRPAQLSYCIDRFEYPNQAGVRPATMVSYREAKQACRAEGKRLCEAEEWFFACEGPRTWPYPTGIERDAARCNIDRRTPRTNKEALARPRDVSVEMGRLDQRIEAGSMPRCISPFGVHDTMGNVAEWVHNRDESDTARATALAGGSWAREPATCRRLDASHGASFRAPTSGFRCCADPLDGREPRRVLPAGAKLPHRRKLLE